ncbi:MAG: hypothetical protein RI985_1771 [Chloroflexota bacterium]|jgi:hypothetical protein
MGEGVYSRFAALSETLYNRDSNHRTIAEDAHE